VDAVLLRPLPYAGVDRLVRLHEGIAHQFETADLPAPDVIRFARENRTFADVAGFISEQYEVSGAGQPFAARAERVTASLLPMLGAQPFLGRAFTRDEDEKSTPVALISYGLWREKFQGDAGVVGKTVELDRRPYTIIGVMPREFEFPLDAGRLNARDLWVPMSLTPEEKQDETDNFMYGTIARLKPGATLEQAQADVSGAIRDSPDEQRWDARGRDGARSEAVVADAAGSGGPDPADRVREFGEPAAGAGGGTAAGIWRADGAGRGAEDDAAAAAGGVAGAERGWRSAGNLPCCRFGGSGEGDSAWGSGPAAAE
jgi:hypothetical protein